MKVWYTYVDWTLEKEPRAFYVGKGNDRRVNQRERNRYWQRIATKYQWRREVVFVTRIEEAALDLEKQLIIEHRTYTYDNPDRWGCNFTRGGDGISGYRHTIVTKIKLSAATSGVKNGFHGKSHSLEMRSVISEHTSQASLGKRKSDETRARMKRTASNRPVSHYAALSQRIKSIQCFAVNGELICTYASATEAVQASNGLFTNSGISEVCNGKAKTHRNFIWKFTA